MLFCQLDYPQELGTGTGATIKEYGCAITSVASVLKNVFHKETDPELLNFSLVDVKGYASNDAGAYDILKWDYITKIYPDILLAFNKPYYNPPNGIGEPANMDLLDSMLNSSLSVIVGVSFNHNTAEPMPTHYVEIYKKNPDGTYQCRDPWFRGDECDTVFDTRYAVNGMHVSNAILQMVAYMGELLNSPSASSSHSYSPSSSTSPSISPSSSVSPSLEPDLLDTPVEEVKAQVPVANVIPDVKELPVSSESINTLKDVVRKLEIERNNAISKAKIISDKYETDFKNYTGLVAGGYDTIEKVKKELEGVGNDILKHRKQLAEVLRSSEDMAKIFASKCKEDIGAIEVGSKAITELSEMKKDFQIIAQSHKAKPTLNSILSTWDMLLTRYAYIKKELNTAKGQQVTRVAEQIAQSPVLKQFRLDEWVLSLFGVSNDSSKGVS